MITLDEWKRLKIGDEIHCAVQAESVVHTLTVAGVREEFEKKVQVASSGYFLGYMYFCRGNYFVNKQDAINYLIKKLNAEIDDLDHILEETKKQLEIKKWKLNKLAISKKNF